MKIELKYLPKVSLNDWYSGRHWSYRSGMKNEYKKIIRIQTKEFFRKAEYDTEYKFYFQKRPLDASNCVAMVKLIEDILFESDSYQIVRSIKITSEKAPEDLVVINVKKI